MSEVLDVKKRESRGKRHARRQRAAGSIPAILYGHGEESVSLTVNAAAIDTALRHGSQVVDLEGDVTQQALIREIQWDTFGAAVLHIDFTRVGADEKITVTVPLELRGVAPGTSEGGVVQHPVHDLEIECSVADMPDKLQVNINNLKLGESVTVADLEVPAGTSILLPKETVVVQCVEIQEEAEDEGAAESVEPELISRKAEEEAEGES